MTENQVNIPVYIFKPRKCFCEKLPCLLNFHGGGFMTKASPVHFARAIEYAKKLSCIVIMPDYRLLPKHTFPIPSNDCFAVYKWILDNEKSLNIDLRKFVVMGDSAGGALCMGTMLRARDYNLKMPKFQLLIYPMADRKQKSESCKIFTDTPVWNSKLNAFAWKLCFNNVHDFSNTEYISPLDASSFHNIPSTYIEVADIDCLRDEGIELAQKLESGGVKTELVKTKNTPHGYDCATKSKTTKKMMKHRIELLLKEFSNIN